MVLEDEGALIVVQAELLGIVAAEVAHHVHYEHDAPDEVYYRSHDGVPVALGVDLAGGDGLGIHMHPYRDPHELYTGHRSVTKPSEHRQKKPDREGS